MSRKIVAWKIEVQPRRTLEWMPSQSLFESPDDELVACKLIASQIERHVDGVAFVSPVPETAVCSFCLAAWTERSATYNGGCCDADEANNPKPEVVAP